MRPRRRRNNQMARPLSWRAHWRAERLQQELLAVSTLAILVLTLAILILTLAILIQALIIAIGLSPQRLHLHSAKTQRCHKENYLLQHDHPHLGWSFGLVAPFSFASQWPLCLSMAAANRRI